MNFFKYKTTITTNAACNDICKYLSGDSQSLAVYSQGQTVNLPVQDYSQSLAGYSQGQFVNLPVQDDSQILAGYSQRQSMNLPVHADNAQLMDSSTQTNISKLDLTSRKRFKNSMLQKEISPTNSMPIKPTMNEDKDIVDLFVSEVLKENTIDKIETLVIDIKRNKRLYFYKNFLYVKYNSNSHVSYYDCIDINCSSSLLCNENNITLNKVHNHPNDYELYLFYKTSDPFGHTTNSAP
ncbi:unnamed protein product [Gordionus sp. m RMFG-2023]